MTQLSASAALRKCPSFSPWWMRLVIIAVGSLAYANSFTGPFVFDDYFAVQENRHVQQLWPIWEAATAPPNNPCTGRPLVSLSLALNYAISGTNTWSYHAFNLIVHLMTGLGLFEFVRRLLHVPRLEDRFARSASWITLTIATLWIAHPLCTESITYISTRTESLMGMFFIWTMYCALRSMTSQSGHARHWSIGAMACCWCSAASKEVGAMAPIMVLLMDRTFISGSFAESLRRRSGLYLGLFSAWLLTAALVVFGPRGASVGFETTKFSSWTYLLTQSSVILHYLRLAFWPSPLVIDYHDWPRPTALREVLPQAIVVSMLVLACLYGLFLARRLRWRMIAFAGAWFFVILAPSSSVLPLITEVAAERRMYLPLMAVVGLTVMTIDQALRAVLTHQKRYVVEAIVVSLTMLVLLATTIDRNSDYHSALALWTRTVSERPQNARARVSLAQALSSPEVNRPLDAVREYRSALELEPTNFLAHANLAILLVTLDQRTEALEHARLAVKNRPQHWITHRSYGAVLGTIGRSQEAELELREALRLNPQDADTWIMLAQCLADQHRMNESQQALHQANLLSPPK